MQNYSRKRNYICVELKFRDHRLDHRPGFLWINGDLALFELKHSRAAVPQKNKDISKIKIEIL